MVVRLSFISNFSKSLVIIDIILTLGYCILKPNYNLPHIIFIQNRADQNDFEKNKRKRASTPPRIEQFTAANLVVVGEKIKSDNEFAEAAPVSLVLILYSKKKREKKETVKLIYAN